MGARYIATRDKAASVTFAFPMQSVDDDELFAYCSKLVMGLAQLRAGIMHSEAFQLPVWDGKPANGVAGTERPLRNGSARAGKRASFPSPRSALRWTLLRRRRRTASRTGHILPSCSPISRVFRDRMKITFPTSSKP